MKCEHLMAEAYPFNHHPCWTDNRQEAWERIHLPIAPRCNVKCAFCDHNATSSCHVPRPGYSSRLMKPREAFERTMALLSDRPNLRIVAVAGPGEPFANNETLQTMSMIRSERSDLKFCLSTNGVLLADKIDDIVEIGLETVTVSVSTVRPKTAAVIYEWAEIDGTVMRGISMGERIIQRQLKGISEAAEAGIHVKCNTIMIPSLNATEMKEISQHLSEAGASIQNIVPLVPYAGMSHLRRPTRHEIALARQEASEYCRQFTHCRQCRSDVVGIPGNDTVL
nr:MAG: hypothetical protein AM324_07760 [Candidatus Thorarchaeota archaeon SMTZ1-83]